LQAIREGEGSVDLQEEQRLCYVAMTRAKTELFMTWRKEVPVFTADSGIRYVKRERSRFLDLLVTSQKNDKTSKVSSSELKSSINKMSSNSNHESSVARGPMHTVKSKSNQFEGTNGALKGHTKGVVHNQKPKPQVTTSRTVSTSALRSSTYIRDERRNSSSVARPSPQLPYTNVKAKLPSQNANAVFSDSSSYKSAKVSAKVSNDNGNIGLSSQWRKSKHGESPRNAYTKEGNVDEDRLLRKRMDSTWFFPVGSEVMHKRFGRGIVLPPPARSEGNDMIVLVEFEAGNKKEFSVHGSDLSPIVV